MDLSGLKRIETYSSKHNAEVSYMDDLRKYLTVPEVAKKLDITEEWVRDLIARKEIKAVKIGQWKIKPEDLDRFIKSRYNVKEG